MLGPHLGGAGGSAQPLPLSAHQFSVLLMVTLVLPVSQPETPSAPCPIWLSSFHYFFLLLSPIAPSLPRNPQ